MGETTGISWTDHTWNPWYGCHKVSQGCKHCYMFREQVQYGRDPNVVVRSKTTFTAPLRWREGRVFTCSWSDWFIEEADEWRDEAWRIIRMTQNLTYQILTKRPERFAECLPLDWGTGYPNVWLGVSAEDQENFDKRMPFLSVTPAKIKFVSLEPLLGPIRTMGYLSYKHIDWVIVGGESGPGARNMEADWARSIRDQCIQAGIPFFFKQWSGLHPAKECELDGVVWRQFPERRP